MNDNNNNVQVGNIGSMQMNMNMVMVGRQLEKFKREKEKFKERIKGLRKGIYKVSNGASNVLLQGNTIPNPLQQERDEDWSKDVRNELSSILEDIPTDTNKPAENSLFGSIWSFGKVLNSVFEGRATHQHRRSVDNDPLCYGRQPDGTDYTFMVSKQSC